MRYQWRSMDKHTSGIKEYVIITHTHTHRYISRVEHDKSKLFRGARTELFSGKRIPSSSSNGEAFIKTMRFPREAREKGTRKIEHLLAVKPPDTCSHILSPSRLRCTDQPRICITYRAKCSLDQWSRRRNETLPRNSNQLARFRSTRFYGADREKRGPARHPGLSFVGERTRRRRVNPLHFDDHLGWATQSPRRKKVQEKRKTTFYRLVDIFPREVPFIDS